MRACALVHFGDFGNVFLSGSICSLLYSFGFFGSALVIAGPGSGQDPQSTWKSGFILDKLPAVGLLGLLAPLGLDPDHATILWDQLKKAKQALETATRQKNELEHKLSTQREWESAQALQFMDNAVVTTEGLLSKLTVAER